VTKVSAAGFPVTEPEMQLATDLASTMFNRAGGARPSQWAWPA
jgi:hypothetical protein